MTLQGVKESTIVNNIGTILKIGILVIFMLVLICAFKMPQMGHNFFGHGQGLGSLTTQIKSTMLVTLWLFFGIEGAVVVSGRAKSQKDVKKATMLGFIIILAIYALVSLLPYGVFSQAQLAKMANPSMSTIMTKLIGPLGGSVMNIGIFIAVASSWIVWLVMVSEMPAAAAANAAMPQFFAKQNQKGAYKGSLLVSTIVIQIMLILSYFFNDAWGVLINVTASMALPCYLFSMIYLFRVSLEKDTLKAKKVNQSYVMITSICAVLYTLWLIYAADITYLISTLSLIHI